MAELTPERISELRELHRQQECSCREGGWCGGCDPRGLAACNRNPWPCDLVQALDRLRDAEDYASSLRADLDRAERVVEAARAVCALFGKSWPRIEVMVTTHDRPTMPLCDDDADRVRALRKALANAQSTFKPGWLPEQIEKSNRRSRTMAEGTDPLERFKETAENLNSAPGNSSQPEPSTEPISGRGHRCDPRWEAVDGQFRARDPYARAGTVWECTCGRTWVAYYQSAQDALRSGWCEVTAQWRREGWWERRRRIRREAA